MKKKETLRVCRECGISANVVTCIKRYGAPPKKLAFDVSTFASGKKCDFCGRKVYTTQARDFFYPDFELLKNVIHALSPKTLE